MVALADVPPCKGSVQVGDGLGVGDGAAVGVGVGVGEFEGAGEALGVGLADAVGEGVAGGLPPVGPAVPQATTRIKSAIDATPRMPPRVSSGIAQSQGTQALVGGDVRPKRLKRRQFRVGSDRGAGAGVALSPEMLKAGPRSIA